MSLFDGGQDCLKVCGVCVCGEEEGEEGRGEGAEVSVCSLSGLAESNYLRDIDKKRLCMCMCLGVERSGYLVLFSFLGTDARYACFFRLRIAGD